MTALDQSATPIPADRRATAAAILRAVADLIETRPDLPEPGSDISFYLHGEDAATTMAAIASALPCGWRPRISRSTGNEYLHLDSDDPGASGSAGQGQYLRPRIGCVRARRGQDGHRLAARPGPGRAGR